MAGEVRTGQASFFPAAAGPPYPWGLSSLLKRLLQCDLVPEEGLCNFGKVIEKVVAFFLLVDFGDPGLGGDLAKPCVP